MTTTSEETDVVAASLSSPLAATSSMDHDRDDTALLLSLGANIVDREQFESNLVEQLEQRLQEQSQAEGQNDGDDDLEEGQLSDKSDISSHIVPEDQEDDNSSKSQNYNSSIGVEIDDNVRSRPGSNKGRHRKTTVPQDEETEHEKRVRRGEVTPFGTELEDIRKVPKK